MSSRTITTLGAVAEIITGPFGSMLHQSDYTPTGIPVIMPQDIGNRTLDKSAIAHVGSSDAERLSRYKVQENDIVYARRGDVEKHAFICKDDIGALCGTGCMRVRVDAQKAIPMYISFYLNRPESKRWISQHAVGSNMPNLNTEILNEVPLELPSIDEQLKTITILNSIDRKIQSNICICTALEAMAKTIYDYWFTQFDFPDADGKPYRSSGGTMEWNEQLKRNVPHGWCAVRLGDICTFRNGINYEKGCKGNRSYSIVNVRNITASGYLMDASDFDRISLPREQADRYALGEHDIIIARSGTPGATRLIMNPEDNVIFCGFIICCTPIASEYRLFISQYLKKLEGTNATKTGGSILQNVSQDTLKSLLVCLPNKTTVEAFNAQIMPLVAKMDYVLRENRELTKLRDWLLPMLMNGQATVAESKEASKVIPFTPKSDNDQRFAAWMQNQGVAARGDIDMQTMREIFDAMDDDDK